MVALSGRRRDLQGGQLVQDGRALDRPQAIEVGLDRRPVAATPPRLLEAFAGRIDQPPDLRGRGRSGPGPGR